MIRAALRTGGSLLVALFCACSPIPAQQPRPAPLDESGKIVVTGRSTPYLIRHLPVSSFPELPAAVVDLLNRRGCLIPQTYQARRPENVVHASFEGPGSSDWAVLCSVQGTVSLLVFFSGNPAQPAQLASMPETKRLQSHPSSDALGFNWGIDPASPQQIRDAQIGLAPRPAKLDHDALADSVIDHKTVYHFYAKSAWTQLEMPE